MELTFKTERISGHITRIFAFNSELMYLVEGGSTARLCWIPAAASVI